MADEKKQEKAPERKMVKVKLLKDHTHARVDYKAGAEIEVFQDQIAWLEQSGVIQKNDVKGKP